MCAQLAIKLNGLNLIQQVVQFVKKTLPPLAVPPQNTQTLHLFILNRKFGSVMAWYMVFTNKYVVFLFIIVCICLGTRFMNMENKISTCNKNGLRDENKKKRLDAGLYHSRRISSHIQKHKSSLYVYICDTFSLSPHSIINTTRRRKERVTVRILLLTKCNDKKFSCEHFSAPARFSEEQTHHSILNPSPPTQQQDTIFQSFHVTLTYWLAFCTAATEVDKNEYVVL